MGTTAHNPLEGRRWWWPIAGVALLVLAYYLTIPIVGPYFLKVCHRATQGAPEGCIDWDILTALVLTAFDWLDDHNGVVGAIAGLMVAGFTGVLWWSTEKLWAEAKIQQGLTRESIAASVASADAAAKAANVAEKALTSLETPYIYPISGYDPAHPREQMIVRLKNYGRSPATVDKVDVGFHIMPANVFDKPALASFTKAFMSDVVIGDKEVSEPFYFEHQALRQYQELIEDGRYSLHLSVAVGWRSAIGGSQSYSRSFIWHWRYKRFVYGSQLWDEIAGR